ncbi:MAG: hypothetical protein H0X11_03150 [Betaproteobacteria bacterium]|nr:hypothetical protein [Betaproteobacteria bacterium]
MGLTHSWLRPTELPAGAFTDAVRDIQRLLKDANIPLAGFEGQGPPVFLDDAIVFNGVAGAACEPFEIHQVEFDRRGRAEKFSFCKTQGLPYDLVVMAALIVFKHHLGETFKVMSDESDAAWSPARQLVSRATGLGSDFKLDPKS